MAFALQRWKPLTVGVPMIVMRMRLLVLGAAMACAPGSSHSTARPVVSRPPFDSATIERLCVQPDRVRAGWAECVLKDQSPQPREIRRPPPGR
jgi:hypothetical protein